MTAPTAADPMAPEVTLEGDVVRLVPISLEHVPALLDAALVSRENYQWTPVPGTLEEMTTYVSNAIERASRRQAVAFTTTLQESGRVVGSTRFATFEFHDWPEGSPLAQPPGIPDVVEIGWTWLAGDVQRSAVNTEAKRLMLTHAFETWGVKAVRLKTDRRNERSWNAILRIGATFDGVIRAHSPGADGTLRDSAYFSLLAEEWPAAGQVLVEKLAR
jgi:RimJ/RimL family protein N-acetyltransferase